MKAAALQPDSRLAPSCPFAGGLWPHEFYAMLNETADALRREMNANPHDKERISAELDEVMSQRQRFRDQCTMFLGMLFRIAAEEEPNPTAYALDKVVGSRIVKLESKAMEHDDDLEALTVAIETLGGKAGT